MKAGYKNLMTFARFRMMDLSQFSFFFHETKTGDRHFLCKKYKNRFLHSKTRSQKPLEQSVKPVLKTGFKPVLKTGFPVRRCKTGFRKTEMLLTLQKYYTLMVESVCNMVFHSPD